MSTNGHKWEPKSYAEHAEYVYRFGEALLALIVPQENEIILDLGCGTGELSIAIEELGSEVLGIDSSPEMVTAARANGINAILMDAREMNFDNEFNGIISNAAIHWMSDIDKVLDGCYMALKVGGRFVGEFGGSGNVGKIISATVKYFENHPELGEFVMPWYFPSVDEFSDELVNAGFFIEYIELFERPTPLPTGIRGWLITYYHGLMSSFTEKQKEKFLNDISDMLKPDLYDEASSTWFADYVRLRFKALK